MYMDTGWSKEPSAAPDSSYGGKVDHEATLHLHLNMLCLGHLGLGEMRAAAHNQP